MIRRTSGWTARNKRYVFFLFNDMLLWTTRDGSLQNAVQLRNCEIMPSSAKQNPNKKFEVVYRGEKHKTLWLECASVSERNAWYEAVKRAITTAKEISSKAWSKTESLITASYKDYEDEDSDGEHKTADDNSKDNKAKADQGSSESLNPYSKRYAVTSNFRNQEFKEIDPMDDNLSQISEQDIAFNQEYRQYSDGMVPTSAQLSPFENTRLKHESRPSSSSSAIALNNPSINSNIHGSKGAPKQEQPQNENKNPQIANKRKKSNLIIRSHGSKSKVRPSSQFKLRLDNF